MFWPKRPDWFLALLLAATIPAWGHETDQFTWPGNREFADLGREMNAWMYDAIERGVEKTNAEIRRCVENKGSESELAQLQSQEQIVKAVNGSLPWAMDVIEGWEKKSRSEELKRRYPGRVIGYKEPFKNIYQHVHFPLDPRQFFRLFLGSTLKVYGTYLGTDKIGHFTDMGMNYYRDYSKQLRAGKSPQEAEAEAVRLGTEGLIFAESGMLGYLSCGAYSNADLAANYVGLLFYRNLTEPIKIKGAMQPPMLVREGPYWKPAPHVRRDSDFFAVFVSDHYNEALNPSRFEAGMRKSVHKAIEARRENILDRFCDENGNRRPREWFEKQLGELRTYYGVDYGHRGTPEELVSIASVCFPEGAGTAAAKVEHARPMYLMAQANPNAPDAQKRTVLHLAIQAGDGPAVRELLGHGADISARDGFGTTPLHLAAARNDARLVAMLLEKGAPAASRDDFGCTPLHDAARSGSAATVKLLLEAAADANAADAYATTPLHLACRQGSAEAALPLLQKGANPNAQNTAGSTPLHEAAASGNQELTRLLLERGAKPASNRRGQSPADLASENGFAPLADSLR